MTSVFGTAVDERGKTVKFGGRHRPDGGLRHSRGGPITGASMNRRDRSVRR
jgi:hypothetical protein